MASEKPNVASHQSEGQGKKEEAVQGESQEKTQQGRERDKEEHRALKELAVDTMVPASVPSGMWFSKIAALPQRKANPRRTIIDFVNQDTWDRL